MSEGLFKKRKSRQTLEYIIKEALGEVRREHNGGIEDGILSQLLALYLDDAIWYQVRKKYQDHLEREIS